MGYAIKLEKHKDYSRFNLHGVIVEGNRFGEFSIELYEDIEQHISEIQYIDNSEPRTTLPEHDFIRTIYAGATLSADRLEYIIEALQEKLNMYNRYKQHEDGEIDGNS